MYPLPLLPWVKTTGVQESGDRTKGAGGEGRRASVGHGGGQCQGRESVCSECCGYVGVCRGILIHLTR